LISWSVPREWEGGTAVLIGGGPSLNQDQLDLVGEAKRAGKVHVIAINNAYQVAPWADVLYASDGQWWRWHYEESCGFGGLRVTRSRRAKLDHPDLIWIEGEPHGNGLSKRQDSIANGELSGFQAINLAVNYGAKKILLLGFDMRTVGNQAHWHGDHPNGQRTFWPNRIPQFRNLVPDLQERGAEVVNCTPGSALDAFSFGDIEHELCQLA
jgi:hypothetical protein